MRDLGPDIIIFTGAVICIAYGSLVIATRASISDELSSLLGSSQKIANQQKPSIIKDSSVGNAGSLGNDLQNYVNYSFNGAVASIVVGVLQMVVLIFKHSIRPTYYLGGRR
jgi:hypothetical protein